MTMPPIPPNCPHFEVQKNGAILFWTVLEKDLDIGDRCIPVRFSIKRDVMYWRPVIAAVARCAWLDEARKTTIDDEVAGKKIGEWEDAVNNAEAWRAWGEQK